MNLPADPKVRRNGVCALPSCEKPRPPVAVAEKDPFCSTSCCRQWHGLPDISSPYQAKTAAA